MKSKSKNIYIVHTEKTLLQLYRENRGPKQDLYSVKEAWTVVTKVKIKQTFVVKRNQYYYSTYAILISKLKLIYIFIMYKHLASKQTDSFQKSYCSIVVKIPKTNKHASSEHETRNNETR